MAGKAVCVKFSRLAREVHASDGKLQAMRAQRLLVENSELLPRSPVLSDEAAAAWHPADLTSIKHIVLIFSACNFNFAWQSDCHGTPLGR
ncbi:MAG TPA: hypothetical protein VIK53_17840 [Verrucomicrobiae bacterium]